MTARVYVGTYATYNSGSIKGAWIELADYGNHADFMEACRELHKDEADPELMFQDYEGFPSGFYNESSISPDLWDWLALTSDEQELVAVYQEHIDSAGDIDTAREAFMGRYSSPEDWAAQFLEETGTLFEVPAALKYYIDFEAYARDAEYGGDVSFVREGGETWVFSRN